MQIFELHFNPKLKEEQIFDSFIYEPENVYEKELGGLYMVGELQNTLPQNLKLLDNLAKTIKRNYYNLSLKSPEKALSQSLKRANEFLAEEVKKENVGWLGNLNFGVLSLKGSNLFFSKTGNLKILLIRAGQIIDLGKNLDTQEIEPYPLKIFFNVVSGKLFQDDKILILTKEVFDFFHQQNLLTKIAQTENINGKNLKEILPSSLFTKDEGLKVSGICFLSVIKAEVKRAQRPQAILFQKEKKFSLFKLPKISFPKLPRLYPVKFASQLFNRVKLPRPKIPTIKIPVKPSGPLVEKFQHRIKIKRKLILIIVLVSILVFGWLIFKRVEQAKESGLKASLAEIEEKVIQAKNFLIFKNEKEANVLLKEAWEEISALTEKETPLKQKIREELEELNKLEKIENPEIASREHQNMFSPLALPENFDPPYDISASYLSSFYFLDKETCEIIKYPPFKIWKESDENCSLPKSMAIDGSVWILNGDDSILRYHTGSFQETIIPDFFPFPENITKIKTKADIPYLYLLEPTKNRIIIITKEGEIIKQFQSEKFDNLKDFAISEDGKTIYLLNDPKVYKVEM